MILPDYEIVCLARRGLVNPYDPELVNPASLDVRLGENLLIEDKQTSELQPFSIAGFTQEAPFMLQPRELYWRKRWSASASQPARRDSSRLSRVVRVKGSNISWPDTSTRALRAASRSNS